MIICHSGRWVGFAPWKTASSTLHRRLSQHNESPYERFFYFNTYLNRVVHQHITCADFVALPESRLGYSTFSFVRNPYDRWYSGFNQLKRSIREHPTFEFKVGWIKDLVIQQLAEIEHSITAANGDFETWACTVREEQVFEIGRNTGMVLHPAHYWTHINGEQFVQYIGRVENFEVDLERICVELGIQVESRENANVTSSNLDPGRYRYVDRIGRAAKDRINELFAKDFELFGYEMM